MSLNKPVRIEKIIAGGYGLARRADGMVVLTRYVLPGETVSVREIKHHRGYVEAELDEVLGPSSLRVIPPCPVYTQCGGCDFQHISPQAQLRFKEDILRETLQRAGIDTSGAGCRPILPSPSAYQYRHRLRLKLSPDGKTGFYRTGTNVLVPTANCQVATLHLNRILEELQASPMLPMMAPSLRELELLQSPADGQVYLLLHLDSEKDIEVALPKKLAETLTRVKGIFIERNHTVLPVAADTPLLLRQDFDIAGIGHPVTLRWTPGCFSQVNAEQNQRLIALVYQMAGDVKQQRILDLFCGMGNFSIPLAAAGALVTGIERSRESVARARDNAASAGFTSAKFIDRDVAFEIKRQIKASGSYDIIVLDPPRQGLGRASSLLADLDPARIIYISCDPATLARDLRAILATGYSLTQVTPVDMFPQTHHIETVALLEKN